MKQLKIAFDAKRALLNNSGLGNYSRWTIDGLCTLYPQHNYYALSPRIKEPGHLPKNCSLILPSSFLWKKFNSLWRMMGRGVPSVDIFHGLSNELPFGLKRKKVKSIVTIHDLIFLRYPEYYSFIDRKIYDFKFKYAAQQADQVIAISEQTAQDLIQYYKIPENKIQVIYQDCNAFFHVPSTSLEVKNVMDKYHIQQEYLVSVGTIEERKNQINSVKAFEMIANEFPSLELVIVGKRTAYQMKLETEVNLSAYKHRIKILNDVSTAEVKHLYTGSKAAVYLSVFEGFGLPVLEALNCGVPVLTSNVSSMPEAGGEAAMYCDPLNAEDIAKNLKSLLRDEALRAMLESKREKHIVRFRKEHTLAQVMELYHKVCV